jgi:hypothetical protein
MTGSSFTIQTPQSRQAIRSASQPKPSPMSIASVTPSARSSSVGLKPPKNVRKTSQTLMMPSPVSHKDFAEDTVQENGLAFELVQPKRSGSLLSPSDVSVASHSSASADDHSGLQRKSTLGSMLSSTSIGSRAPLPETDEWGFLKDESPVPEIFQRRAAPEGHRATEQRWLSTIATPLPSDGAGKKVHKLVLESGIPASLRGKVWAWFMSGSMSARVPGLYQQLLEHDKRTVDEKIDQDIV